jgi:predicted Zn-dependent peptidase
MIPGRALAPFAVLLLVLLAGSAFADSVTLPAFHRFELDNGTVLLFSQEPEVPLVSVAAVPAEHSGLANLLASLLEKGAGERDAAQFAETVDASGGSLTSRADLETITISGTFLARDAGLMVELLSDMLLRPRSCGSARLTSFARQKTPTSMRCCRSTARPSCSAGTLTATR